VGRRAALGERVRVLRVYRDAITPLRVAELMILRDDMPRLAARPHA
jgi:uncharacterized alpha-E superfamily protein